MPDSSANDNYLDVTDANGESTLAESTPEVVFGNRGEGEPTGFDNPVYEDGTAGGTAKRKGSAMTGLWRSAVTRTTSMVRKTEQGVAINAAIQEEDEGDWYQKKGAAARPFAYFARASSIHGYNRLPTTHTPLRIFWTITVVLGWIASLYYITELYDEFKMYPYSTNVEIASSSVDFPNVTICNSNLFGAAKLMALKPTYFDKSTGDKLANYVKAKQMQQVQERCEARGVCPDAVDNAVLDTGAFNVSEIDKYGTPEAALTLIEDPKEWERLRLRIRRSMPDRETALVLGIDPNFIYDFDYMVDTANGALNQSWKLPMNFVANQHFLSKKK